MKGLFKTIKRFLNVANKARVILDKTRRLFRAYFFMQVSMQEGGLGIHLMELPFIGCSKGNNKVNGVHFGNRGNYFDIVNALNL